MACAAARRPATARSGSTSHGAAAAQSAAAAQPRARRCAWPARGHRARTALPACHRLRPCNAHATPAHAPCTPGRPAPGEPAATPVQVQFISCSLAFDWTMSDVHYVSKYPKCCLRRETRWPVYMPIMLVRTRQCDDSDIEIVTDVGSHCLCYIVVSFFCFKMQKWLSYKCVRVASAGGVTRRTVTCTDQSGAKVDAALCTGIRPSTAQRCNLQPCDGTCDAATTCLGRGTCAAAGTCTCARGFSGPFCQVCSPPPGGGPLCACPCCHATRSLSDPFASNACEGCPGWNSLSEGYLSHVLVLRC